MAKATDCIQGKFYKFDRDRPGREIGEMIPRVFAQMRLGRKQDVYTPTLSDARALAKDVRKGKADWEGAHEEGYYPHFHPGGEHEEYGHIFYGQRGYRLGENRKLAPASERLGRQQE